MKAIQFTVSAPRYLFGRILGPVLPSAYVGPLACTRYQEVPVPALPGPDWVRIRTHYGGICGTDLNTIYLHAAPSLSPFSSQTFVLGHEQVGTIAEVGENVHDFVPGQRVVVDPILSCPVRGIDPPCRHCQEGEWSRCENLTAGDLSPGMLIGACADTGGSWAPSFVAHRRQLYAVPDEVSDENALLTEPFCVALHPVLRCRPEDDETALVIGAGTVGLCIVAALRASGSTARVIVLARHRFQGEWARHYGADEVIYARECDPYLCVAERTGATLHTPLLGKRVMVGGADIVYECVGSDDSIDDALRFTRAGGCLALIGTAGQTRHVDWTPVWVHELRIQGFLGYSSNETFRGRVVRPHQLALEWMSADPDTGSEPLDLSPLLTHTFRLKEYRRALQMTAHKSRHRLVKAAFVFD